ncbi:type I restriction/modification system, specificity subunit [Malaciobacter marinus]|uniref:Type I restriction/modification system, specificity subunit n=1 Tax=Malaciobacter marinus TaxID=505249 RepID=A0A347TJZ1_9BACT|nr:restriction endonuclease subunit S [Malaciobacter marinus]AXX86919.1 type I restriction/modification system, specificity subunit [Malaciobacter marinus]PHO15874.1 hypothetical protein CPH92_04695 [Malaciobacter marinus]
MSKNLEYKKLKEIGKIFSGNSINAKLKEEKYTNINEGIPYIATKDIDYNSFINYDNGVSIPLSDIKTFRVAPKNSVLICAEGGSAGRKIGILNQDVCFVNKLFTLEPNHEIIGKYVFYWYKTNIFQKDFKDQLTGLIGGVSKAKFGNLTIPVVSFSKQKQIVEILDKAFEAIDKAKENLEKNIQNSKELFQSRLNEIFSQKGEGWEESTILEVCNDIFAGGDKPEENFSKEKTDKFTIPIFANAVKDKGLYGYTNKARVNESAITISARGSGTGHTEIRMESFFPIVRLIVLVPNTEKMSLIFLKYIIDNLDILRSGSAIPQLTVPMIKEYKVDYPSLKKQNEIIDELDSLKQQTKQLETHYQQKLQNLEELKKSILQKAFSGELI